MSQQWRVKCLECGTDVGEYLRMHSKIGKNDEGGTVVECNNCDNRRTVGTGNSGSNGDGENSDSSSSAATDGGTDAIGNGPSVQGEIGGWGQ